MTYEVGDRRLHLNENRKNDNQVQT